MSDSSPRCRPSSHSNEVAPWPGAPTTATRICRTATRARALADQLGTGHQVGTGHQRGRLQLHRHRYVLLGPPGAVFCVVGAEVCDGGAVVPLECVPWPEAAAPWPPVAAPLWAPVSAWPLLLSRTATRHRTGGGSATLGGAGCLCSGPDARDRWLG